MTSTHKPTRPELSRLVLHADRQPVAVVVLDVRADGQGANRILYANAFAERLLGYSPGELAQRTPAQLFGRATDLFDIMRARDTVMTGARTRFTARLYRRSGEPVLLDGAAGLVERLAVGRAAQPVGIAVALADVPMPRPPERLPVALVALQRLGADLAEDAQGDAQGLRLANRPDASS